MRRSELARGWKVILAAAVAVGIGITGSAFYTIGIFLKPLSAEYGWSRAALSSATLFLSWPAFVGAPLLGKLIARFDVRKIVIFSMAGVVLGYLGMTQVGSRVVSLYAALVFLAIAGLGTTPVAFAHVLNGWFERRRGLSLGLMLMGTGWAAVLAPRFVDFLIRNAGWRAGYIGLAGFAGLVALPLIIVFFRESPTLGSEPLLLPSAEDNPGKTICGVSITSALKSTRFWKLSLGTFLIGGAIASIIVHLVPLLTDAGIPRAQAIDMTTMLGFAIIAARVLVGYMMDQIHAPFVAVILLSAPAIAFLLLSRTPLGNGQIVVAVLFFGLAAGAEIDLVAYLASRYFGLASFGVIYGLLLIPLGFGAGLAPMAMGHIFDVTGHYVIALYIGAAACLLSALLLRNLRSVSVFPSGEQLALKVTSITDFMMSLPPKVSALIRATIFVRDLERAATFYAGLGLNEIYYEGILEDASACAIIGYPETHPFAVRIVKRAGPNFGMVGLFQLDKALNAPSVPPAIGPARIGEVALIFYVRSMSETLTVLRAAGATWSPEPQIFRMEHREQFEVCLRDPDGILINLVETDPAEQERTAPELAGKA